MTTAEFYALVPSSAEEVRVVTKDRHSTDAEVLVGLLTCYGTLPYEAARGAFPGAKVTVLGNVIRVDFTR